LIKNTTNEWVENYNGIHELNGKLFIAKNGNTLFFPATVYCNAVNYGFLWTASLNSDLPKDAFSFYFGSNCGSAYGSGNRMHGFPVRGI